MEKDNINIINIDNLNYLGLHPEISKDFHIKNKIFFISEDKILSIDENNIKLRSYIEMIIRKPVVFIKCSIENINILISKYIKNENTRSIDLEKIIEKAFLKDSSDIHFESIEDGISVKIRKDGILFKLCDIKPKELAEKYIMRIKVLAECDIGETLLPQDGRFSYILNKQKIELRVSILPSIYGESIVLRILKPNDLKFNIDTIGFSKKDINIISDSFNDLSGFYLISGPTGSGKTTTAYTLLETFRKKSQKLVTIEEPVEYMIKDSVQMKLNRKKGLDFSNAVRTVIRHDPDIIFIGEIRDAETACSAIEFALTGHIVITTIHSSSVIEAFERLINLNIKFEDLLFCTKFVINQKLIRKICDNCNSKGCKKCLDSGYNGRTAIFEILKINKKINNKLNKELTIDNIEKYLKEFTIKTFEQSALEKLDNKITDIEEIKFVISQKKEYIS